MRHESSPISPFISSSIAPIDTSLFDLLKCGPGPSSSHTIGPMKAGFDFLQRALALEGAHGVCATPPCSLPPISARGDKQSPPESRTLRFHVTLYGSLSATGAGHGTHAAVLAGLMGHQPAQCPPGLLQNIVAAKDTEYIVNLGHYPLKLRLADVEDGSIVHNYPYSNTLIIALLHHYENGEITLLEQEYYSVGGGFVQWKGWTEAERGQPTHPYHTMRQLKGELRRTGLTIHELILENETAITGIGRAVILDQLGELLEIMMNSVRRGLDAEGPLPGTLGVQRKARSLYLKAQACPLPADRFLTHLNAYAMATAEENADGGVIVTAPTCGAAGVLPALLYAMRHDMSIGDRALREGLLAAVAVAFLAKRNAAIAGAEVGCQGEVGVASAMGAAMLAHARGASAQTSENAAEIALEHHLGLTCDPVGGYVQIPCIERNAMGALKAYNANLIAGAENPFHHRVSLDSAIAAMAETGRDMNAKFKETSLGGLAVSMINC